MQVQCRIQEYLSRTPGKGHEKDAILGKMMTDDNEFGDGNAWLVTHLTFQKRHRVPWGKRDVDRRIRKKRGR